MDKTYDPQAIEQRWYKTWEDKQYFAPRIVTPAATSSAPSSAKDRPEDPSFCIMIPPPNVTGVLHMGHAFQDTIMDALTRYHRMNGHNALWQAGTDHAGIATQMVVEQQLRNENLTRSELGREAFVDKVWQWKTESGGKITQQLRRMGASLDWTRERFTLDEGLSTAVVEVFTRLYDEGLIYRGKRLVNWDPILHTAVSDLEVISEEENGHLWHIRYPIANSKDVLIVATTRPETMLGDAAVAVHPEDARYQHLVGKTIALPLTDREIPIVADEYVDQEFGTGCVKITPAHDFNDYEIGERHQLEKINIFTVDASINDNAPLDYQGLDRIEARKKIIEDLKALDLLEKVEDHKLMIPRGDRSGAIIEPLLTDQWYVKVGPLAEPAIDAVKSGKIRFVPDNWKNTYFEWMNNIQDWCISRQIWWGHRIPAWYDQDGKVYVGHNEQAIREKHQLADDIVLRQDEDVLDTWFSSALWPFSTLGWPEKTPEYNTFYPTNVLVTGFDIIFFWVARMIMMGLKFTGDVPFREIYIHGLVRDSHGQKMSKSKGNVLDPLDLIDGIGLEPLVAKRTQSLMQAHLAPKIEKATRKDFPDGIPAFGTDALRFTFAAMATTGRNINFDLARVEGYRNFCNKLWNAARYVLMNTEDKDCGQNCDNDKITLSIADQWIISCLQQTKATIADAIAQYRFDLAAQAIYEFTWNEYCDWYLELSKPVLMNADSSEASLRGSRHTLVNVLEEILRIAHPIMPFITEEIWQRVNHLADISADVASDKTHSDKTHSEKTIMLQPYPQPDETKIDLSAIADMTWIKTFILGLRKIRGEMNIKPSKRIPVMLQNGSPQDQTRLTQHQIYIETLGKTESITWLNADENAPDSATALVGEMKVLIPLADLIDKNAEIARLSKDIDKMEQEHKRLQTKLSNQKFVERAPEAVVKKEQDRLTEIAKALESLQVQLQKIKAM